MTVFASEHLGTACQSGVRAFFALANPTLQGVQAVVDLNTQAIKAAMTETEATLKGAIQSQNPLEFLARQVTVSQQAAAKAISYGQHLVDIATTTQAEWTRAARAQSEQHELQFGAFSGPFAQNVSTGVQAWIAAMNPVFSAAGATAAAQPAQVAK
ncbi:TIGR01841 family phasin [Paraburkholderia acidipaludis]|uniref:TIGR01841 family phasin n=1 Tax=Paraburkholderia acidipaludis TaxID=660537 RepID=UPI0006948A33|nr:TIGR01841 family phasin [Paraburkholderia acidipaludis]